MPCHAMPFENIVAARFANELFLLLFFMALGSSWQQDLSSESRMNLMWNE